MLHKYKSILNPLSVVIFAHLAVADLRITGHLRFCPNKACSSPRYTCVVAFFPGAKFIRLGTYIHHYLRVCHTYTALFGHIKKDSSMCSHKNCQKNFLQNNFHLLIQKCVKLALFSFLFASTYYMYIWLCSFVGVAKYKVTA